MNKINRLMGLLVLLCLLVPLGASAQSGTLADVITSDERLSTFESAMNSAELSAMFNGPGPYTIFAPTDAAFSALGDSALTSPNGLRQTLLYHTLQGAHDKAGLYKFERVKTALGKDIRVQNFGNLILNDSATIVVQDVQTSNGILHLIDVVLDHNATGYGGEPAAAPADAANGEESAEAPPPPKPTFMPESDLVLTSPSQNPAFKGEGQIPYWSGIHADSSTCKGTTWVLMKQMDGVSFVGSDRQTNPYRGDTNCRVPLPLLCLNRDFSTPPRSSRGENYHEGWAGGRVRATVPITGDQMTSMAATNGICAETFGPNWRAAQFHDGGYGADIGPVSGWDLWAYGGLHNNQRYWVMVNDQPSNPFNSVQPAGFPTMNTWVDQILFPGGDPAYQPGAWMNMAQGQSAGTAGCKGMTWAIKLQQDGMVMVGADRITNAYTGDTSCEARLRILCIRVDGFEPPANSNGNDYTQFWSGGTLGQTFPVSGHVLSTRASANQACVDANGSGWRMAEFHDGSLGRGGGLTGWQIWAYGGLNTGGRFWVSINDQPANPWNP